MASQLHKALYQTHNVHMVCIRQASSSNTYQPDIIGVQTDSVFFGYFFGIINLMLNLKFWRFIIKADLIIYNTVLTFPLQLLIKPFRKRTVCYVHERTRKNLLYTMGFLTVAILKHKIVTPSKSCANDIIKYNDITVIPNSLDSDFITCALKKSERLNSSTILFLGFNKPAKGSRLISSYVNHKTNLQFVPPQNHSSNSITFTSATFQENDFLIVLEDDRIWMETFSLVTFEAAASGCIPIMNTTQLHSEFWSEFPELLISNPDDLIRFLSFFNQLQNPNDYRHSLSVHAKTIADPKRFQSSWQDVVNNE